MLYRSSIGAVTLAGVLAVATAAFAFDDSKYPDFSGQWQRPRGVGIQWDPSRRLGLDQHPPLTAEYQAVWEASMADQAAGGQGNDAPSRCVPYGMPRMMTTVFPMEIVITPSATHVLSDYTMPRRIFTDGREFPKEIEPNFNGYSIGKWIDDGHGRYDALEVETRILKGPRTFEASGIPMHADNETVVKERIYLDPENKDVMHNDITTYDHALTKPWAVNKRYLRVAEKNVLFYENECSENNQHVVIGKEGYYLSADGYLMPVKKGQRPPDLRYFK